MCGTILAKAEQDFCPDIAKIGENIEFANEDGKIFLHFHFKARR